MKFYQSTFDYAYSAVKTLTFLLCFFTVISVASAAPSSAGDAEDIRGPTFEGVIFTPDLLPHATTNDPDPLIAACVWPNKGKYWTPSAKLVRQAEQAFAEAVIQANKRVPFGGPHYHGFYSPKNFSHDRETALPDDIYTNFLYYTDLSCITPQAKRQYIGVTVAGKKMLVMNFVYNEHFANQGDSDKEFLNDYRHEWMYIEDAGTQIFYDLGTGKFSEIDT